MSKKRQAENAASLGGEPLAALKEHVTGAIEAGKAEPVIEQPAPPITINEPSLPALAKQINAAFVAVDGATLALHDKRIEAGQLLKMARERMPEKGVFAEWCKANIKRGRSDIYRCLTLVKSDDPDDQVKARETEKSVARESVAASRERQATAPKATVPNVGEKALAAVNASKPQPSAAVWAEPASQTRDKGISAQATALSTLTGYALRDAMTLQIRLLQGNKIATMTDAARMELLRLLDKLRDEIKPGV